MTSTYFKFRDSSAALLPTLYFPEIHTALPDELFEVTFSSVKYLASGIYSVFFSHHYLQMCSIMELEDPIWIKTIIRNT